MRPRRAALRSRRGTLCFWPATVTPTSSVGVAFHCARRLRVFARDILRLGTAMVGPNSSGASGGRVARHGRSAERRRLLNRIVGDLVGAKTAWPAALSAEIAVTVGIRALERPRRQFRRATGHLDAPLEPPANLPVGWLRSLGSLEGGCAWRQLPPSGSRTARASTATACRR